VTGRGRLPGAAGEEGGSATIPDTAISLNRGSAGRSATAATESPVPGAATPPPWNALLGISPAVDWQLGFGDDARALFDSSNLADVLLVISRTGQAPLCGLMTLSGGKGRPQGPATYRDSDLANIFILKYHKGVPDCR
jgi:hypothetical protein